jgi:hypothetical protein
MIIIFLREDGTYYHHQPLHLRIHKNIRFVYEKKIKDESEA